MEHFRDTVVVMSGVDREEKLILVKVLSSTKRVLLQKWKEFMIKHLDIVAQGVKAFKFSTGLLPSN